MKGLEMLERFRVDPAVSSAVFVTMCTDCMGFLSFLGLAAIFGHGAYTHANVSGGAYTLTVIGFLFMTLGGWLGGAIVFVHGMRVLSLVQEPAERAVSPVPHAEKEQAEGG